MFADDLNAWRAVSTSVSDVDVFSSLRRCRAFFHAWGRANRVQFDADMESSHILSGVQPVGDDFKLLGIWFDAKLLMSNAVDSCVVECSWEMQRLLRARRFHTDAELI
eukprot:2272629-Pyramimonas_sp.AAC.1